jgi:hypothetical protein
MSIFGRTSACCLPLALAVVGLLVLSSDAEAYIDPGMGSLGYQAALAAMLGIALVARQIWSRLAGAARSIFGPRDQNPVEPKP